MCHKNEVLQTVQESKFARAANRWSWIPGLGLILFLVFTPIALLQLGKGRSGFYLIRRAFVKVIFLSVLPIILLVYWAELPENYYPDFIFQKHGAYKVYVGYQNDDMGNMMNRLEEHYYFFGNLFKKVIYYNSSKIMCISHYNDNKLQGLYLWYYNNGQKRLQTTDGLCMMDC